MNLDSWIEKAESLKADLRQIKSQIKTEKQLIADLERKALAAEEAHQIIQTVAQQVQEHAHKKIAEIVSDCLSAVFSEPYVFRIVFEKKRGKTEARLVFERDGMEIDPLTASGGGVVDIASFALRISCLMLSKPQVRRLVVLDEPFKFVSEEYRPHAVALIQTLSERFGIQFIIVSHLSELEVGNVIRLP